MSDMIENYYYLKRVNLYMLYAKLHLGLVLLLKAQKTLILSSITLIVSMFQVFLFVVILFYGNS